MPLVALMWSAPSAVVSDDRLCLSLLMENPQRVYVADQNLLPFCMACVCESVFYCCLFVVCVCLFVVHTHAGQAHDQSINQSVNRQTCWPGTFLISPPNL